MEDRIIYKNDVDSAQILADIIFGKNPQTTAETMLLLLQARVLQKIADTALYEGEDAAKSLIHKIKRRLLQDHEGW